MMGFINAFLLFYLQEDQRDRPLNINEAGSNIYYYFISFRPIG